MEKLKKEIKKSGLKKIWIAEKLGMPYVTFNSYLYEIRTAPKDFEQRVMNLIK